MILKAFYRMLIAMIFLPLIAVAGCATVIAVAAALMLAIPWAFGQMLYEEISKEVYAYYNN